MSKNLKVYFKRGSTVFRLDNFPKSFRLLSANWKVISDAYLKANQGYHDEKDPITKPVRRLFAKVPKLVVSLDRFEELKADLKVKGDVISFYLNGSGGRFLELRGKSNDEEE